LPRLNGENKPVIPQHDLALDMARGGGLQHELLHALPVAVYTTDASGRMTFYNKAAATLCHLGRSSHESQVSNYSNALRTACKS
jgi:hypothetical protein